jgi:hypothetical protein
MVTEKSLQNNISYVSVTVIYKTASLMTIDKLEAATAVVVAPDNGYENARNMLSSF